MADQNVRAARRRELVLDTVRQNGGIRVAELADRFGVSSVTVRRDLEPLVRRGAVRRVHGGAMAVEATGPADPASDARSAPAGTEAALADAAVQFVEPGNVVALAAGSTTLAVAERLLRIPGLTVVTNSLPIADLLWAANRDAGTAARRCSCREALPTGQEHWSGPWRTGRSARCTRTC